MQIFLPPPNIYVFSHKNRKALARFALIYGIVDYRTYLLVNQFTTILKNEIEIIGTNL